MMGTSASPPAFSSQSPLHNDWKLWSSAEAELRVNPPNVRVDNKTSTDATIITVDSANRCAREHGQNPDAGPVRREGGRKHWAVRWAAEGGCERWDGKLGT